jgi:hypothetical protein
MGFEERVAMPLAAPSRENEREQRADPAERRELADPQGLSEEPC